MQIAVNTRFLLPGNQFEGVGRFTEETLRHLVRLHPEVTFHFLFDRAYDPRYLYGPNVVPHVLHPSARHPFLFVAWFEGAVALWLARHRPTVLLSTDGFTTLATTVPRVTVFHDLAFEYRPKDVSWMELRYYKWFMPRFARASAQLVTVSEHVRQDVARSYGLDPARIRVAYNAPAAQFAPRDAAAQAATRVRFSQGKRYFLFVGALQPRKNLGTLLQAFDQFKTAAGPAAAEAQLLIVGRKAWKAGPIYAAYQQMHHADAVHFTGRVGDDDLVSLYAAAHAAVYVPYMEGFGIPIVEAQACGCPVLTSNVTSMPEVAGPAAVLADPTDVASIAAGLARLWADEDLRVELVQMGFENLKRFSWEASAKVLWAAIEDAVAQAA